MAGRIDDLEIPDGATPDQAFVQILDPATGTGTFLVEVIDLIFKTMTAKWQAEGHGKRKIETLWNAYVPEHLLPRLHGYELMMAPYAIAHMKIGLKLYETGYRFESDERARIYLTNALEPAQDFSGTLAFAIPALAYEAEAVNVIKRDQRFTVVIGNPPYSSVSQNNGERIRSLVNEYLVLPDGPIKEKSNRNHLQDDYVKFIRFGHDLANAARACIVSMITNNSYLTGSWYRGMRYHLLSDFPLVSITNLHGGKGFVKSSGDADQNVFSIMQSVAVGTYACGSWLNSKVSYAELVGPRSEKYGKLLLGDCGDYALIDPEGRNQWQFQPVDLSFQNEWVSGISLEDVFQEWGAGVKTNRNGLAVGFTPRELRAQIEDFADLSKPDCDLESKYSFSSNYQWSTAKVRAKFSLEPFESSLVTPYLFRAFDARYIYWHPSIVFNMRGDKMDTLRSESGALALLFSRTTAKTEYSNFLVSRLVTDHDCLEKTKVACIWRRDSDGSMFSSSEGSIPNYKYEFVSRLCSTMGVSPSDSSVLPDSIDPNEVLSYMYAFFYSPIYRSRYRAFLNAEFPRLFLPGGKPLFDALSILGSELISLHTLESQLLAAGSATWLGVMGSQVEKVSYSDETVWIDKAKTRGFKGVPEEVWNFHIGGYQVCEKWLKDRQAKGGKNPRPGRVLTDEDIEHYQKIVVALSETIRIMAEIDEVIEAHGGWPGAFQTGGE